MQHLTKQSVWVSQSALGKLVADRSFTTSSPKGWVRGLCRGMLSRDLSVSLRAAALRSGSWLQMSKLRSQAGCTAARATSRSF